MGKRRLLRFLSEKRSEYRIDELHAQITPNIDRDKLEFYCIEFLEKGWIERDKKRQNAYRITDKGRVYHSSSWWSNLNPNQRINIMGITIASIISISIASLGFYLNHIGYI